MPVHGERTIPFPLQPEIHILIKINRSHHLSYTTELPTWIDLQIEKR
jgi:hypothetical protein